MTTREDYLLEANTLLDDPEYGAAKYGYCDSWQINMKSKEVIWRVPLLLAVLASMITLILRSCNHDTSGLVLGWGILAILGIIVIALLLSDTICHSEKSVVFYERGFIVDWTNFLHSRDYSIRLAYKDIEQITCYKHANYDKKQRYSGTTLKIFATLHNVPKELQILSGWFYDEKETKDNGQNFLQYATEAIIEECRIAKKTMGAYIKVKEKDALDRPVEFKIVLYMVAIILGLVTICVICNYKCQ